MRIAIAGANSFIGKRLLRILSEDEVTAIVREGSSFTYPGVKIVHCNMDNYSKLGDLCGTGDVFIDLTWRGSRGADRQDKDLQELNYLSTIEAMKSMSNVGYKTLVSAGSQAEYGLCEGTITEDTPLLPNTEYGKYKVRIFNEVSEIAYSTGSRFIEPRYFSLYGPGDYERTLIMSTLKALLNNERIELNRCTQLWDYLYVDDAVEGLMHLCKENVPGGVYNFASGKHRMLCDYIVEMKETVGSNSEILFGAVEYNGLYIDLRPDVSKLKSTGWIPKTSFENGIKEIVREQWGLEI